jgi:hypothetical protein
MSKNKSVWDRIDERNREDEEEAKNLAQPARGRMSSAGQTHLNQQRELILAIENCEVFIDKVQNLWTQYLSGIEKFPPHTHAKQLEDMVTGLNKLDKPLAQDRFKLQNFLSKYAAYKDRWDRLVKDLEAGKIKRRV